MDAEKSEVLRYLGRCGQDISPELLALIEECMPAMRKAATPRIVKGEFSICFKRDGISLKGTNLLLIGESIRNHLNFCVRAIVFAATLGAEPDNLIRRYERIDITRALVLDACATRLIEQFCDETEEQAQNQAKKEGIRATPRFSPGYGDLPLALQPELMAVLDTGRQIGLTCTESLIMLPRKSVTAIIGLGEEACEHKSGCASCSLNDCVMRR